MITQQEILQLLTDTESHRVERTTSKTDSDKFCQVICGFANDLSGSRKNGYLMIGAYDNGELSGLRVDDNLLLTISNIRTDGNILPQPVMTVEKISFEQGDLLVAEIQPSEYPPVRYRGRVWVRVGPRKSVASEEEEKILTERRLSNVRTFDAKPILGATLQDLDVSLIKKEFLSKAVAEDILAEDKRTIEEQLASLGFFDLRYNCPTVGAIVLFGNNPERYVHGSYVQYVRFKGKDRAGDIIHEFKFDGSLCKSLPKIDTFVETSVSAKRPIPVSVLREEIVSKYPYWATRELLMNAIMHRDYDSNAPIQFYEYDDRIEIQNPGGLYGKVSPDNFPNVSDYRNPFIAEAMKVLGYVNRFSRGVYRVRKELKENGNGEAAFELFLRTAFRVVENISEKYFEEGFGTDTEENTQETPKKHPRNTQETPKKRPRNAQENTQETPKKHPRNVQETSKKRPRNVQETSKTIQGEIVETIKNNPSITRKELETLLGRTPDSIKYNLAQLSKTGVIKHTGSTKAGKWIVIEKKYK